MTGHRKSTASKVDIQIVRLAEQRQHASTIAHWYHSEWAQHYKVTCQQVLQTLMRDMEIKGAWPVCLIATKHNCAVGAVELKYYENRHFDYEHWLGGLYVSPEYRNSGVGGLLINHALTYADKTRVSALYLQCRSNHFNLYRQYGFQYKHNDSGDTAIMVRLREGKESMLHSSI